MCIIDPWIYQIYNSNRMSRRIIGLETEYGCLIEPPLTAERVIPEIRDWFFDNNRFGLIDTHDRDWDEPEGNGGFLFNGGRIYVDMGHIEYCTPECASAVDTVRYDRAGDLLLVDALDDLGYTGLVKFFRNNIDHYTGATFGCHENYSMDREAPLTEKNVLSLLAFQSMRVLFSGSGRVGTASEGRIYDDVSGINENAPYQLSQRADYIHNDFFQWVQHNRAIINTRDEPLADPSKYRRLHLLHSDTNVLPANLFLKVGASSLVLDLLEDDAMPAIVLDDAVGALHTLNRKVEPPWYVFTSDGREANAVELLYEYWKNANQRYRHRDTESDAILNLWKKVMDGLARDCTQLIGDLDWVTKHYLLEQFMMSEKLNWNDPWLKAQDIEYHNVDPANSLGLALANRDGIWEPDETVNSKIEPPKDTRAFKRSNLMRDIEGHQNPYILDWDRVELQHHWLEPLLDPFET